MVSAQIGKISVAAKPPADLAATARKSMLGPDTNRQRKSARILIVDDDSDLRNAIAEIIQSEGHGCTTASNGAEGLKAYGEAREKGVAIDLVISDITMPRMNGIEMLVGIREIDPLAKVIIMSADRDLKERSASIIDKGAAIVLQKPVFFEALLAAVEKCL